MNIDVREYLRINPISVHELTLSGDGKDCFLYFPNNDEDGTGYEVYTQNTMFWSLYKSIFQDLIYDDRIEFRAEVQFNTGINRLVVNWDSSVHLNDNQFKNYVRRKRLGDSIITNWEDYKAQIEAKLSQMEEGLDETIINLRRKGKIGYAGGVEIQSPVMNKIGDFFQDFAYATGLIWCCDKGRNAVEGNDDGTLGTMPLQHTHPDSKAETTTFSFSAKRGGGELIGDFSVGSKVLVSNDKNYHMDGGTVVEMIQDTLQPGSITYPLFGENVIDWRNPRKTHNNIPPSYNVRVRYKEYEETILQDMVAHLSRATEIQEEPENETSKTSASKANYQQSTVLDLPSYGNESLTQHDYLLRMTLDGISGGQVLLMKQTVQMLLDIFADDGKNKLGRKLESGMFVQMQDILRPMLDIELVPRDEFLAWYNRQLKRLDEIQRKLEEIRLLIQSVPVIPYVGKIIVSTTDSIEQNVIAHYGGKKWRRIVNFIRGVDEGPELGKKIGEEYVCLRESDIPIHTHDVEKRGVLSSPPGIQNESAKASWLVTRKGGHDKKLVNCADTTSENIEPVDEVSNMSLNYQISPLEYQKDGITVPHDNMPPYREVYIWECLETTDEEKKISGESWEIEYDMNGHGSVPSNVLTAFTPINLPYQPPPAANVVGYDFIGWIPKEIPEGTTEKFRFSADWKTVSWTITFDNGGHGEQLDPMTYTLDDNGIILATLSEDNWDFRGWTLNGQNIGTVLPHGTNGDITLVANWTRTICEVTFDGNGGTIGDNSTTKTIRVGYGKKIPEFPEAIFGEIEFDGWFDQPVGGTHVTGRTIVTDNMTVYATWTDEIQYEGISNAITANGVARGFNGTSYVKSVGQLELQSNFELKLNVTTGEDIDSNQTLISLSGTSMSIGIKDKKFTFGSQDVSSNEISPNTRYFLLAQRTTGDKVLVGWSIDEEEWESSQIACSENATTTMFVGTSIDHATWWNGSVEMPSVVLDVGGLKHRFVEKKRSFDLKLDSNYAATGDWPMLDAWFNYGEQNSTRTIGFEDGVEPIRVTHGEDYPQIPVPSSPGYVFKNWRCNGVDFPDGEIPPNPVLLTENSSFAAMWKPCEYKLVVEPNGGTYRESGYATTISPETTEHGIRALVTNDTVFNYIGAGDDGATKRGHTLIGYYEKPTDGDMVFNADGQACEGKYWTHDMKFKGLPVNERELRVYAHWERSAYVITWSSNCEDVENMYTNKQYGDTVGELPAGPERVGYTFSGWWTSPSAGVSVTENKVVTDDISFYAHWVPDIYKITFNGNGGSPETQTRDISYGSKIMELPFASRLGYQFVNWISENVENLGATLSEETVFKMLHDASYIAEWTANTRTITFNPNGGSLAQESDASKHVTYGLRIGTMPLPRKVGYGFAGWFTLPVGGSLKTEETIAEDTDMTLYAHWEKSPITITFDINANCIVQFDSNGGTEIAPRIVPYGETITSIPQPTKEGWNFDGWYCEDGELTNQTQLTSDRIYVASWSCSVVYDAGGGEFVEDELDDDN